MRPFGLPFYTFVTIDAMREDVTQHGDHATSRRPSLLHAKLNKIEQIDITLDSSCVV